MKKIFTAGILALLLQANPASGQSGYSYEQYEAVFNRIDQTISDFVALSPLQERREASAAARQRFTALFTPDARLDDDLCTACQTAAARDKDVEAYVNGLLQDYPKGLESVRLLNANIDYSGLDEGTVQAYLQRGVTATTTTKTVVNVTDLVRLTLRVDWSSGAVKIASVSWLGNGNVPEATAAAAPKPAAVSPAAPPAAGKPTQLTSGNLGGTGRIDIVAPPIEVPTLIASPAVMGLNSPALASGKTAAAPPVIAPVAPAAIASKPAPAAMPEPVPVPAPAVAVISEPAPKPAPAAAILSETPLPAVATAASPQPLLVVPIPAPASLPFETVPLPGLLLPVIRPMAQISSPEPAPVPVGSLMTTNVNMGYEPAPPAPQLSYMPTPPPAPVVATTPPLPAVAINTPPAAATPEPKPVEEPVPAAAPIAVPEQPAPAPHTSYRRSTVWDDPMYMPHLFVSANLRAGTLGGDPEISSLFNSYDSRIAARTRGGEVAFDGGSSIGADVQLSYFFGRDARFGVGAGLLYLRQNARLRMDEFAVDYRSTDRNGNIFRQRITANGPVEESFTAHNLSLPLLLKGRFPVNDRISFTADAGLLLNLQVSSDYSTNASFDYEAFYLFDADGKSIYDMGAEPAPESWMISRSNYEAHAKEGQTADAYFASFTGYNVGISKKPASGSGKNGLQSMSLGFLIQPGVECRIGNRLYAAAGLYYLSQGFRSTEAGRSYRITDAVGSYNSLGGTLSALRTQSFGLSLGLKFALH